MLTWIGLYIDVLECRLALVVISWLSPLFIHSCESTGEQQLSLKRTSFALYLLSNGKSWIGLHSCCFPISGFLIRHGILIQLPKKIIFSLTFHVPLRKLATVLLQINQKSWFLYPWMVTTHQPWFYYFK